MARIGILTSGGDCPGLNAVIRACVVGGGRRHNDTFVGVLDGWRGIVDRKSVELDWKSVSGISKLGGTILGTSRTNPLEGGGGIAGIQRAFGELELDALIAVGGEGSLAVAKMLSDAELPVIGVPKTVDNDLSATDYSFGFDTAVEIATEAIDRLKTTGESHHRCMIAEVMGRNAGWIALHAGMATSAHAILIPEQPASIEEICGWVKRPFERGRVPLVVVAEGFTLSGSQEVFSQRGNDAFGRPRMGGIGEALAPVIEERTGIETRATTLGHIQRGGVPSASDRVLATRLGLAAVEAVHDEDWGKMVAVRATDIVRVDLAEAIDALKVVPAERYEEASVLFG
jgi:6-phosphofructokinase 1